MNSKKQQKQHDENLQTFSGDSPKKGKPIQSQLK